MDIALRLPHIASFRSSRYQSRYSNLVWPLDETRFGLDFSTSQYGTSGGMLYTAFGVALSWISGLKFSFHIIVFLWIFSILCIALPAFAISLELLVCSSITCITTSTLTCYPYVIYCVWFCGAVCGFMSLNLTLYNIMYH